MKNSVLEWLLEENNPSIRYRVLTEILAGQSYDVITKEYDKIWNYPLVKKLFIKKENDQLASEHQLYLKYLTCFAELGFKKDFRIDNFANDAIVHLTNNNYQVIQDNFCSSALILRALIMLGYHEDERLLDGLRHVSSASYHDGGFVCSRLLKKNIKKSCYKASLCGLLLYASCFKQKIAMDKTSDLIAYFTNRNIFYVSKKTDLVLDARVGWRNIDNFFPPEPMRIGIANILEALATLGSLETDAFKLAFKLLEEKKLPNGRFLLDGTIAFPYQFGKVAKENKWVTFYYLLIKKYCDDFQAKNSSAKFVDVKLEKPSSKYLRSYYEACAIFKEYGIKHCLDNPDDYQLWKDTIFTKYDNQSKGINLEPGYVPSTTYWLVKGNEFIGMGNIRHYLTPELEKFGGHIGYSINKKYWNQGYGTLQLKLLLEKAKELALKEVIITCDDNNLSSSRVIEKNNGIFLDKVINEIKGEKILTKRYRIVLD